MNPTVLTQMYDDIKNDINQPKDQLINVKLGPGGLNHSPGALMWRNKAAHHAEHLKDKCRKHLILDIYCKILPLDDDFIHDHQGVLGSDVDAMLAAKGMTPTQYLMSCSEATHAPLVDYLLDSTDRISRQYMEEAEETLKDAQEKEIDLNEPVEPETDDEEVASSLVDVTKDTEYENFIDKLKQKTIDKIVRDISDIIEDKKEEDDLVFKSESATAIAMDYMNKQLWGQEITEAQRDEMIGLAIRESALREIDNCFNVACPINEFTTAINLGKGAVVNESAVSIFKNSVTESQEGAEEKAREAAKVK